MNARSGDPNSFQIDPLDRAIIGQLQESGRRSYRAIARDLGVAEGTVRARMNRLLVQNVVRIVAVPDPQALGYDLVATVLLRVVPIRLAPVLEELASWPEVIYAASCAGRMNALMQLVCADRSHLADCVDRRVVEIGDILDIETVIELEVKKFRYLYPDITQLG